MNFRPALCSTAAGPRASSMLPRPERQSILQGPVYGAFNGSNDGNTAVDITLKVIFFDNIKYNTVHLNNSDDFDIIHFTSFYQQQTALLYHYCT